MYWLCIQCGLIPLVALALFMGCVPSEVRKGADLLAVFTHQVSEEGTDFARSRTALTQARRANIAMLEVSAEELDNGVSRDIEVWALSGDAGKRRMELMRGIRAFADNEVARRTKLSDLRRRHDVAIATAKAAVDLRQAELSKVSQALASLSQDFDFQTEVKFLVGYFEEVRAEITKAKETAGQYTKAAQSVAKDTVPKNEGIQ